MSDTILTAENLKFRYDAEQPVYALDGVSAQVKRGEFVAVLGANGCGKSTLAKHFNAILLPESGKVYVEAMDTADDSKLYDIRQTVIDDIFSMTMKVALDEETADFNTVQDALKKTAEELGVQIQIQREEVFKFMYNL